MYTVDASVWVNGFDQREAGHATSRQLLEVLRTRALPIIVPNVVLVEVAGAISRTRQAPGPALGLMSIPPELLDWLREKVANHRWVDVNEQRLVTHSWRKHSGARVMSAGFTASSAPSAEFVLVVDALGSTRRTTTLRRTVF